MPPIGTRSTAFTLQSSWSAIAVQPKRRDTSFGAPWQPIVILTAPGVPVLIERNKFLGQHRRGDE